MEENTIVIPAGIKTPECLKDGATMTSLELVEFINVIRTRDGEPPVRHDNFMQKVPKVLKEEAVQFEAEDYWFANGGKRKRRIYRFPQRESYLMAMAYSYTLQRYVYDAMVRARKEVEERAKLAAEVPFDLQLRLAAEFIERKTAEAKMKGVTAPVLAMPNFADPVVAARAWADAWDSNAKLQLA